MSVQTYIIENTYFDVTDKTKFKTLFQMYLIDCKKKDIFPVSRPVFCKLLRTFLAEHVKQDRVRIQNLNGFTVLGLALKSEVN